MTEKLPEDRDGATLHFKILTRTNERPDGGAGLLVVDGYMTMNENPDKKTLREIFVRVGKPGSSDAWLDEWAKQVNQRLQSGHGVEQIFRTHVGTIFGYGGAVQCVKEIERCSSILDLISRIVIRRYGASDAIV